MPSKKRLVSESTLEELFPQTLTETVCVNIDKDREVWVATLMCAQYLESVVDSVIVRDDDFKPIGIVGGYELLDHLRKNPTRDFQYRTSVGEIMFKDLPQVDKKIMLIDLVEIWKKSHRAFAVILNEFGDCSTVSARKMIAIGARSKGNIYVSSMQKKKIVTFQQNYSLGKILELMYENKTRKLILENSNRYISDRLILGEISNSIRDEEYIDYFLDLPASRFKLEDVRVIKEDVRFQELCSMMEKMDHPYALYNETVITPWDVCLTLLSEDLEAPLLEAKRTCPHCGKDMD
ncbi:MAG: CBS domain-containing protein [Nitrososphaeraceae archaeon]